MESTCSQRNETLDLLRIMLCFGVIIGHIASSCFDFQYVENGSTDWVACSLLLDLGKGAIPVFAMITGFLFLNPTKELPLKKLYGRNVLRLVLALMFWTWFYAIILHQRFYPFFGQDTNYWYVGMCIGLYISLPVLRMIAADEKLLAYSCWIWFFIRCYYYVDEYLIQVPVVFTDFVFTDYIGYCLWGYYLSQKEFSKKQTRWFYLAGFVGLLITLILPLVSNRALICRLESPSVIVTSVALFLFVIKHPVHLSGRVAKIVTYVAQMTFGIYMVHSFVNMVIFTRMHRFFPSFAPLYILSVIAVFAISFVIILIIKNIPVLKKWVI